MTIDPITGVPIDPRGFIPAAGFPSHVPLAEHQRALAELARLRGEVQRLAALRQTPGAECAECVRLRRRLEAVRALLKGHERETQ